MEKNSIQSESASINVSKATKITAESSLLRSSSNIESAIKAIRLVSGTLENASSKVRTLTYRYIACDSN